MAIANLLYDAKYNTGKGSYAAKAETYRLPGEFYAELANRDLLFDEATDGELLDRLNEKYAFSEHSKYYFYTEGAMMAMGQSTFYDTINNKALVSKGSEGKAPYYVYNAILTMPSESEKLQYAPIARYDEQNYLSDNFCPFFEDCYVECKILYVDGDLYAIIGVSQSYDLKPESSMPEEPFVCILSEKESITTYVDGKYYPNGSIEDQGNSFEMRQNTKNRSTIFPNYPVRVVERLDRETINAVAAQLRDGLLKDKIDAHWSK